MQRSQWHSVADYWKYILVALVFGSITLWQRWHWIDYPGTDYVYFFKYWLVQIRQLGMLHAYGTHISDYPPLYTYLIGLLNLFMPAADPLTTTKVLLFAGEILAAFFAYKLIAWCHAPAHSLRPLIGAFLVLTAPATLSISVGSTQNDIMYTACFLATAYYTICRRPRTALIWYGLACSLKVQAIFLAPFVLVCLLKRWLRWRDIWIVPAVYVALCIPSWLEGRPMQEMLLSYWTQFNTYETLGNAANPYFYLGGFDYSFILHAGLVATLLSIAAYVYVSSRGAPAAIEAVACMALASFCVTFMPFMLPKMFNRFFLAAEIFSLVLACMDLRWVLLAVIFEFTSDWQFPFSQTWTGHMPFFPWSVSVAMNMAAMVLFTYMLWKKALRSGDGNA